MIEAFQIRWIMEQCCDNDTLFGKKLLSETLHQKTPGGLELNIRK